MANESLGANFSIDVTQLKAGLAQANRLIRESESEFKAAAAGMDDWSNSSDGLEAKIKSLSSITDIQKKKVNALQSEYDRLIADGLDPASKEAVELRTKINQEAAALNKNEAEAKKLKGELEELKKGTEEVGEATEEASEKVNLLGAAGGIAVKGIAALAAACASAVGAFFGLAESTREARTNMAKLETSFQTAGFSAEAANSTFNDLYAILGDEGTATEAAQQLAKFSQDEADLAENTRILTGVMAEYGDSIPTEGLAEGMAATAAMGEVQGVLADALEWQGVNLEDYNKKLAKLATEEERAAYIQQTLTDLYGESADAYRENNAAIIDAQKAQAELNEAMNELGAIAEPVMTMLKQLATDALSSITPFVSLIGEGLAGAFSGADGAAELLAEGLTGIIEKLLDMATSMLPVIIDTVVAIVPKLISSLLAQLPSILSMLAQMLTQVITALGAMLPQLIPTIINAVIMIAETLLDNIGLIIDAGIALLIGLADGLIAALPQLIDKVPVIISKLVTALANNLPKLLEVGVLLTLKLAEGLIKAIPQLVAQLPQIVTSIVTGLAKAAVEVFGVGQDIVRGLWNGINDMTAWIAEKIQSFCSNALDAIKAFFGIQSPSRVMADEVGKNLALGIGKGFEDNISGVNDTITKAMDFESTPLTVNATGKAKGGIGGGVVVNQVNNYSQSHSRYELYKTKQNTAAAVRLALAGA